MATVIMLDDLARQPLVPARWVFPNTQLRAFSPATRLWEESLMNTPVLLQIPPVSQ